MVFYPKKKKKLLGRVINKSKQFVQEWGFCPVASATGHVGYATRVHKKH